jgi:transposase
LPQVGHEAESFSPWLQPQLELKQKQQGLPVICLETFQMRAALAVIRNKTDRADASGFTDNLRTGWCRQVQVKSQESYRLRLLLTQRRNLKRTFLDLENAIRHSINSGSKLGKVT